MIYSSGVLHRPLMVIALFASLCFTPLAASATEATLEVWVISGDLKGSAQAFPEKLSPLRRSLRKTFPKVRSFKGLRHKRLSLQSERSSKLQLNREKSAFFHLRGQSQGRYRMQLSLRPGRVEMNLRARRGQIFYQAMRQRGRLLILGMRFL